MTDVGSGRAIGLRRGDQVRVKSAQEILALLDSVGAVDELPFMPEMLPLCGQSFEVQARADKTCDTINLTGCNREMDNTVHLVGARCDGSGHGGCQAGCLLFFKESWLERTSSPGAQPSVTPSAEGGAGDVDPDEAALSQVLADNTQTSPGTYRCQATQLLDASRTMPALRHYARDVKTRNVPLLLWLRGVLLSLFDRYQQFSRHRLPARLRIGGGEELPIVRGTLTKTPVEHLGLEPGDLVEVKSLAEIRATLDGNQRNRNLWYDREMVRYCGTQMRVVRRVERLLDEKTGRMIEMKTPCVILDGAVCVGDYHKLCPRHVYAYFREIWLRRIPDDGAT